MARIVKDAPTVLRFNYSLFSLDPKEVQIIEKLKRRKENEQGRRQNPEDPFFKRKLYSK